MDVPLLCLAVGATALGLSLSGCQEGLGGGARYEPVVVKIVPDDEAAGADAGGAAGAPVEVAGYGTLRGRVIVDGPPPNLPPTIQQSLIKAQDAAFCVYEEMPKQENFRVGPGGELANVFVYLPKAPPGTKQPEGELPPVKFDQKLCTFIPHCLFVQAGQTILILNSDGTLHNTHTYPTRNVPLNASVGPHNADGVPLVYSRAENKPVKVTCDIHAWMGAFHLPLDHPYGAITAEDGTFEITNLPAGKHEFTIWHEVAGDINKRYVVDVPVDGVADVEIRVPAQSFAQFEGGRPKRVVLSMIP
jgi:hypothetical protein